MLGLLNWIPDSEYLRIQFRLKMHKKLDLDMPVTMNEKLQWLKLHDHNPIYSELVDKYLVRTHIEKLLGSEYIIPLLGEWSNPAAIQFDRLPDQFVLKCNHDSGGVIICHDKRNLDIDKTISILQKRLKRKYCWGNREWPYMNVKPLVIAEEFIKDSRDKDELTDYKFYCFAGKPACVLACVDRTAKSANFIYFDRNWNRLNYNYQTEREKNRVVPKPGNLDRMFDVAETIAMYVNAPFVRVDLFSSNSKVYFGEITFYPHSGMDTTIKPGIDIMFGNMIKIPIKTNRR